MKNREAVVSMCRTYTGAFIVIYRVHWLIVSWLLSSHLVIDYQYYPLLGMSLIIPPSPWLTPDTVCVSLRRREAVLVPPLQPSVCRPVQPARSPANALGGEEVSVCELLEDLLPDLAAGQAPGGGLPRVLTAPGKFHCWMMNKVFGIKDLLHCLCILWCVDPETLLSCGDWFDLDLIVPSGTICLVTQVYTKCLQRWTEWQRRSWHWWNSVRCMLMFVSPLWPGR